MNFQIGKKKISEIKDLIDTNCWKASIWIHSLLLNQLYHLFYYHNQVKFIGRKRVDIILNKNGEGRKTIKLDDVDEHKTKWKKLCGSIRTFGPVLELCYSRGLIDEEYKDLADFNWFRNHKLIHIELNKYLPLNEEIKEHCKKGLEIVEKLDKKVIKYIHKEVA